MRSKLLLLLLLLSIVPFENLNAQCSITTSTNASALTCGVAPLSACGGIVYIGDGTNSMILTMNANLDLTCLGPIQLIVRNGASLDFSPGNDYLTLANGSSLILQPGSGLIGGSCNASERIYIGANLIASCNGNGPGADYSFLQLLAQGGYNIVTASASASVCGSGTFTITANPTPASGSTIKWYTVPSGGSPVFTGNPYTTPVISSTTTYYVESYYSLSGFTTPRASVVATVNPLPSAPALGTVTQPTCDVPTGTVVLNGLPASGTWTLTRSGTSGATTTGTGTSTSISGLAVGTYSFTVSDGTCTSLGSGNVIFSAIASATWNGASWSVPPTSLTNLIFNGNYSSSGNVSGCTCTVNIGAVVFNSGHTLSLENAVSVAGGSLTFNNGASLLQTNNVANSGNITYKRNSTPVVLFDYTFWSSPTSGFQTLLNFSPNTLTDKFLIYNNSWASTNPSVDTFAKGIGYGIRSPQGTSASTPTVLPHQFVGVPNNGDVDIAVVTGPPIANRLLGNPYPSTLDADAFINANIIGSGTINKTISGTLYFWTHNHAISGGNYTATDYATYNLSGGTAVSTGTGNTIAPDQYMAAGQGFFIHTVANGNVAFRNNMRLGTNNTNFYRNANSSVTEKHRIWLNLSQNNLNFNQALVGYVEGATNDYNPGYDGLYFGANPFALYSLIGNETYTIQAKALPFSDADSIPIGFKTDGVGELTLSIDHVDGLFASQQSIFLEDKVLNVIHDIKQSPYIFSSASGVFNDRFVLRYTDQPLGSDDLEFVGNVLKIYPSNNEIKIESSLKTIKDYVVYDVLGRILAIAKDVNANQSVIHSIMKSSQTLIVKVTLDNDQTLTKKIIF